MLFFFSSRRRHTRSLCDWSSDVCSSDLARIIEHTKAFARDKGIQPARFEFQMLYGVRRDLQLGLRRQGYNVRVYVPFGTQWYPYLMRRLAERPANVAFLVGNVLRESLRRS